MPSLPVSRHEWVDALRGAAVVGMIWTHCANTFLDGAIQATNGYATAGYYHGLVAPTFFWLAGLMRGMSAARSGAPKPAWPTVKRLLVILAIGYLLHVPWSAWLRGQFTAEAWRVFAQADVLHCLACTGLLLLVLERMGWAKWWQAAGLMTGILYVTDSANAWHTGCALLDAYLNRSSGSLFPWFPWVGFGLAGFLCGRVAIDWRVLLVGAVLAFGIPFIPGDHTTRTFFFERLGWVLMVAGAACHAWPWLVRVMPRVARSFGWLLLAGRESLTAYVMHLVLIYSVPVPGGERLASWLGPTQSLLQTAGWFVLILVLTLMVSRANERRKELREAGRRVCERDLNPTQT